MGHFVMPKAWQQLAVPLFCERVIGFSVPQDGVVLVVSYEGMHKLRLADPVTVSTDEEYAEYDCYDPDRGVAEYEGRSWKIIGLYPGEPIMNSPVGEQLQIDAENLQIAILTNGIEMWRAEFENFSGDWVAATFSPDGNYVVLGCPYDFDFRVWQRL